jgi:decaprenylphospho-beta-D-erythro-pentofuranosid-2-ulose 2-reductase
MKKIMIFGAASAIATETAINFAKDEAHLFLVDLKMSRLESVRDHINAHHKTKIDLYEANALDFDKHLELINTAIETMNGMDILFISHGTLPDEDVVRKDMLKMVQEFNINCTSLISLASIAANYFEEKKAGTIAAITSVAGDRGRQSNYIYGSAKGGATVFLQGLRNRLSKSGVQVLTIKPGQVDTPMTAHMPKGPLFAQPSLIGKGIYDAIKNNRDIVYLPGYWRIVMFIIRHIPEFIFKKLSI